MSEVNYQEYIQTEQWAVLSKETKRLADYRCQVCYKGGELHTHHRTYLRLGHEEQSDLIALCTSCHALFHGKRDQLTIQEEAENKREEEMDKRWAITYAKQIAERKQEQEEYNKREDFR